MLEEKSKSETGVSCQVESLSLCKTIENELLDTCRNEASTQEILEKHVTEPYDTETAEKVTKHTEDDVLYQGSVEPSQSGDILSIITEEDEAKWRSEIAIIDNLRLESCQIKLHNDSSDRENVSTNDLTGPLNIDEILQIKSEDIAPTPVNIRLLARTCKRALKLIEHSLQKTLNINRNKQSLLRNMIESKQTKDDNLSNKFKIKCAGIPYFKDLWGFHPPQNEDVILKMKRKQLLPVTLLKQIRVWNDIDIDHLKNAVLKSVIEKHVKVLKKKMIVLENNKPEKWKEEVEALKYEMTFVKVWTLHDAAVNFPQDGIDWLKISVIDMHGKYSETECESKWMLCLSPFISKAKWTPDENKQLKALAEKYGSQNWDVIANELNTNRSGYQCCIHFQNMHSINEGKWTKEEDKRLKELVEAKTIDGHISWCKISWHFQTRSYKQCCERYMYHLRKGIRRGAFDEEEDRIILHGVKKFGTKFKIITKFLPGRVAPQVRARFEHLVGMAMPKFRPKEDHLLTELAQKYNCDWAKVSAHFHKRSALQCRKRWAQIKRKTKSKQVEGNVPSLDNSNTSSSGEEEDDSSLDDDKCYTKLMERVENLCAERVGSRKPAVLAGSEVMRKLMDYESCCFEFLYGPKPRTVFTKEQFTGMCVKLKLALASLSAETDLSTKGHLLEKHKKKLDKEDLKVLSDLAGESFPNITTSLIYNARNVNRAFIPPNYTTLVGLHTLLLARQNIMNFAIECDLEKAPYERDTSIPVDDRVMFTDAQKLWRIRLRSLFTIPFIFSQFNYENQGSDTNVPKPKVKKKRQTSKKQLKYRGLLLNRYRLLKSNGHEVTREEVVASLQSGKKCIEEGLNQSGTDVKTRRKKRGRPRKNVAPPPFYNDPEEPVVKKAKMIRVLYPKVKQTKHRGRPRKYNMQ